MLDYAVKEAVKEADAKARADERRKASLEERQVIGRELKKEGSSVEFIAKTTKLSVEEIEKL